jgi:hypothetical protein
MSDENPYPVVSSGIELAKVDIIDGLFDRLDAIDALAATEGLKP